MERLELLQLIKSTAYLEGDFVTRAGKPTSYYIDKYLFSTKPDILQAVCYQLAQLLPPLDTFDRIGAPELGAVSLAAVLSVICKKPFIIIKKATKGYGTDRLIEGEFHTGETIVMIEDILTTGGAALRAAEVAKNSGLLVHLIIGVINREEGARENIEAVNMKMLSVCSSAELQSL